ncbi:amidohydrolase family protein [Leucobacter sp. UT-8R-CII-1-4]|uniref:amidohydrolase family protein n=1 Tax=Leucobacter sp. UT-8R-CII-1-4 TaxID=3040075 RepID=UPI0024A9AEE4|nr:amidohydrolase family protein [Leucobacter sp. UT-8R-CII-1-4]MDI6022673.1 amidohydrolase family protein [Leucobacter sp. UT-8R-CII-1-4]
MTTLELALIANGERVGTLAVERKGAAGTETIELSYEVDDNGRGAKLAETIALLGDLPVEWQIRGTSLMGGAVDETFTKQASGEQHWSSQADTGSSLELGFYLPADSSPFTLALLAACASGRAGGTVPLLPEGEARLVQTPVSEIAGRAVRVYALSGVQLSPQYVVYAGEVPADSSGLGDLVAISDGGTLLVSLEWVPQVTEVAVVLQQETQRRYIEISSEATLLGDRDFVVENVRVLDTRSGTVGEPTRVLVRGRRIEAIDPLLTVPEGAAVIDAAGRIAAPGLHDMHAHLEPSSALMYVAAGVTEVRDMGNDNRQLETLREAIIDGELLGPASVPAGFIEGRSPYSARFGKVVDSLEEALEAVEWYAERNFHAIKIYNSFNPEWVRETAARAHAHGMRVQGHVPAFMNADRAIADGYDEITHLNQLVLGWVLDPLEDTRTTLRLTGLTRVADLDLDSEVVQATVRTMVERDISLDVTLVILEQLMLSRARTVIPAHEPIIDHLPAGLRRYRKRTYVPYRDEAELERYALAFRRLQDIVVMLNEAGVKLWPGTDDGSGLTVHRELELFVDSGISATDTLRLATISCAEHLHQGKDRGLIEVGRVADFILVDGDPTQSIRNIRQVALTVAEGRVISPERIYRGFGMVPFAREAVVL